MHVGFYYGNPYGYYTFPAYAPMNSGWAGEFRASSPTYKTLQEALVLVKQAVGGEREDELFYDYLISVAPTEEEREIITSIRDDERKHNRMFREIYRVMTGQTLPPAAGGDFEKPPSYAEGVRKALFGELAAMERYRIIRAGMPNQYYRDMVFEILTDELKHADKYNYILIRETGRTMGHKQSQQSQPVQEQQS